MEQRAELSGGRPGRSTGPPADLACTFCARRSTGSVDRLQARSTGPVDRGLEQRAELSAGRPGLYREQKLSGDRPARSIDPPVDLACTFCTRRSTDSVDRLQARSTGPVDRQKTDQNIFRDLKVDFLA